jgi:hypothetical protein
VSALILNGIDVWLDRFDIDVGDDVHEKIVQGVVDADYVGVLLTASSLASAWVTEELSLAKQRELEERNVILLPLLFEPLTLPLHLRKRKYANFTDFDAGLRELLRTLGRGALLGELDGAVRERVQALLTAGPGHAAVDGVQEVRSQMAARLVRATSLPVAKVDDALRPDAALIESAIIVIDIKSAAATVPIRVNLDETAGRVLARVIRALGLEETIEGQRLSFFLIFDDQPLELSETLHEVGVADGDHLQLGVFTYLIE